MSPADVRAPCSSTRRSAFEQRICPFGSIRHWWGGKSGAKGRLEMAKVSMSWRVLCRHSLEKRSLVQTLLKALDRLFGVMAPKKTAKSHRPQLYLEPKWLRCQPDVQERLARTRGWDEFVPVRNLAQAVFFTAKKPGEELNHQNWCRPEKAYH